MAIDLTGGLGHDLEHVFAEQPGDPDLRESVNAWIWDDGAAVGLPRIGIEAVGDQWETHDVQVNLALPDGRVCSAFANGPIHPARGADGLPRTLGAGPLSFEVIEPFHHLRVHFDGELHCTSAEAQLAGALPGHGDPIQVQLDLELHPTVPPWMNGALLPSAKRVLDTQEEGDLMGHPWRFEQLCRATGRIRVGPDEHVLRGGANRVRRQSVRRLARFRGHAWQAGLFPSGRGFAYIAYPERDDGKDTYNEGYVFHGDGPLVPVRVARAPWLGSPSASGEDVSCTLETVDGRRVDLHGETALSTFLVMPPEVGGGMRLQQAIVRYTWEGEPGTGMLERSTQGTP